jgi:hypothetical protein
MESLHFQVKGGVDAFAEFYALIKIHKTPIATRPSISQSGSLLHGLGRWVDQQLKPLVHHLPCYIKSSATLKKKLETLQLPPNHCYLLFLQWTPNRCALTSTLIVPLKSSTPSSGRIPPIATAAVFPPLPQRYYHTARPRDNYAMLLFPLQ